jgi:hypothetical protein
MKLSLRGAPVINDYQAALKAARDDVTAFLRTTCGDSIRTCAEHDASRFNNAEMNETSYNATQTYGLPVVYPENVGRREDFGQLAPEAGYLLTAAFPSLTLDQANQILTDTEDPGGGFLDDGSPFGVYSLLNLYAAGGRAAQLANKN